MSQLVINADLGRHTISPHIHGQFAEHLGRCIYEGLWVGPDSEIPNTRGFRNDVVEALKQLNMPNLRWPGGCFADTYHWTDGIGRREDRPSIVNVHWGGVTESNHCGTHEFFDLCDQLGCEPYVCGNVGSGTVSEMAQWLEYITMPGQSPMAQKRRANGRDEPWKLTYWGVGNENWGCGGNMRPEYYADLYRQYASYCRNFAGDKLYKIACGHEDAWNEVLMREAGRFMDGLSIHYYSIPGAWEDKGAATGFSAGDWHAILRKAGEIERLIDSTSAIMDRYDPQRRVGLIIDEWGTWFNVEPGTNPGFLYQQNTIRDALVAALSLNIFHAHAERVHMANIAQTVNVLQAMVLTEGAKMLRTPTYHVFEMYKPHQGATQLPVDVRCDDYTVEGESAIPQISASASRSADGKVHVSLCNLHHEATDEVRCDIRGGGVSAARGRILTAAALDSHNSFDQPDAVAPEAFDGFTIGGGGMTLSLPPRCVVAMELSHAD